MWIRNLSTLECTKLLSSHRVGRLACSMEGQPYVVPIYYAYQGNHLYAFSMPGRKIDFMRANPLVCVLVDVKGEGRGWQSVVAEGRYEELPDRIGFKRERDQAWTLLAKHSDWWEPGALKPAQPPVTSHSPHIFFRIAVTEVSGREAQD